MAQETRHSLTKLLKDQGWGYVKQMLESQLELLDKEMRAEAMGMDGLIRKEYSAGMRAGIVLALGMPDLQLSGVNDEIETLELELKGTKDEE